MFRKAQNKADDVRDRLQSQRDTNVPPNLSDPKELKKFSKLLDKGKVSPEQAKGVMQQVWRMNQSDQPEIRERAQELFRKICQCTSYRPTYADWDAMKRPDPPNYHKGEKPYDDGKQVSPRSTLEAPVSATQHGRPYAPEPETPRRRMGPRLDSVPVMQGKTPSR